ncbi:MAG: hypothetical protein HY512_00490 [Candidatus Aenigmarchaeota archaeon]|nr:hypothetical protein [Candidatus Aenigmarchaeota archaeon]
MYSKHPKLLLAFSLFGLFTFLLLFASSSHALLTDGVVVGIPPNGAWRATVELPDDYGVVGGITEFVVKTDCDDWCDLHYAKVVTDSKNPVRLPLYISSQGKQIGDKKTFRIDISALGVTNSYDYGICVTGSANTNKGSVADPCKTVNSENDAFSLSISPDPVYAQPNSQAEYTISVYSQAVMEVEVKSLLTGKTWSIVTDPDKRITATDKYLVGDNPEQIEVEATIKGCTNSDFCKKTATAALIPTSAPPNQAGGDFSIKIDPASITGKKGFPISYSLDITNHKNEKSYDIEIILPDSGLETDFKPIYGKSISGKENIAFKVTPTGDQQSYTFQMKVTSSQGITKLTDATINVNEIVNDAINTASGGELDAEALRKLNEWKAKYKDSDIGTQIKAADDLNKPTTTPKVTRTPTPTTQPKPETNIMDLLLIVVPVAVVIVLLLFILIKKRGHVVEEGEEEGDYSWK